MTCKRFGTWITIAAAGSILAGCEQALIYGDRTGLNLAIRQDVTEGAPLEVNIGLQRRVVSFVPPRSTDENERPSGDAVNMLSRYDYQRKPGTAADGPFSGKVRISTSFASGEAAVVAAQNKEAVETIAARPAPLDAPNAKVSNVPATRAQQSFLLNYVAQSEANRAAYLALAQTENLKIVRGASDIETVQLTILDPSNTEGNARVAAKLSA